MNVVSLSIPEPSQEIEVSFDDFWALYPRRVAKKDARRAWDRISPRSHPAILTALFEWARIWNDRGEPEFIPHPATWLNGERWEDDFPPGHQPYSPPTAAQQIQEKQHEQGERKAMPAHVLDAIRKIRQQA